MPLESIEVEIITIDTKTNIIRISLKFIIFRRLINRAGSASIQKAKIKQSIIN